MQTEQQILHKIDKMLMDLREKLQDRVTHVIATGVVDLESAEDNYVLPKLLYVDALRYVADGYTPLAHDTQGQRTLRQLSRH